MEKVLENFIKALEGGMACLHPTETVPGLSFHPENEEAKKTLYDLKGREWSKTVISLVGSLEKAKAFWKPLPKHWEKVLEDLWPAPLSVVWRASDLAPKSLVNDQGLLALRCPRFIGEGSEWLSNVLEQITFPMPSTSVNLSGQPNCVTWEEALHFCEGKERLYVPNLSVKPFFHGKPSTIILLGDRDFLILRQGDITEAQIRESLEK